MRGRKADALHEGAVALIGAKDVVCRVSLDPEELGIMRVETVFEGGERLLPITELSVKQCLASSLLWPTVQR